MCPGVTQAVSYDPREIHLTRRWSRLGGNIQVLALPFSTQIPDCVVPHTVVQPINCLILLPGPGDTNRESGTSGWREGVTTLPLLVLVPVPGCLPGSEPATCSRIRPASRKFTPASTSETGRKSSAGPEPPPLVHLLPVGPCLTVSDHELEHASCTCEPRACMHNPTAEDEGEQRATKCGSRCTSRSRKHSIKV